jgi:hypothetical protein
LRNSRHVVIDSAPLEARSPVDHAGGRFCRHIWNFAYPAGETGSVTDGYWLMLKPLKRGHHVIHFHAASGDPDSPDFELDVTYFITVGK